MPPLIFLVDRLTDRLPDRLPDRLTDRLTDRLVLFTFLVLLAILYINIIFFL